MSSAHPLRRPRKRPRIITLDAFHEREAPEIRAVVALAPFSYTSLAHCKVSERPNGWRVFWARLKWWLVRW